MNLSEKIEEIKRQPEHIRLRYVWFFVAISMVAVVSIWIFSIKANVGHVSSEINNIRSSSDLNSVSDKLGEQKEALQSAFDNSKEVIKNENSNKEDSSALEKSELSGNSEIAPIKTVDPNMAPAD